MELILALVVVTVLLMPPLSLLLVLLTRSRLKRLEREVRVLTDTSTDLQVRLAGLDRDPARAPDALEPEQPPIAPAQVPVATEAPPPRPPDLRRPATPPLPNMARTRRRALTQLP